jgi:hypothetical protein
MLLGQRRDHVELRAKDLSVGLEAVAAELRLVDVADFIAYIHGEKFANIQDLVNSSVELFFKPDTLSYGWGADFELDWHSLPVVILDMEFHHRSVWLVFKLILRALHTNVSIEYLSLGKSSDGADLDMARLVATIADARLNPSDL